MKSTRWSALDTCLLAIAAGVVTGLGEALALAWRYFVRDAVTHVTPHVAWMAPVGYAILFFGCGTLFLFHPRTRHDPRPVVFLFVMLCLSGWIMMTPWTLHPAAVVVLSAGIGLQAAGWARRHVPALTRALRWLAPTGVALVLAGALGVFGWYASAEKRASGALAKPNVGTPNVLLLVLDTVRASSLGLYGGRPETTPHLERFARSSVVFDQAHSTAPWTLPSHASMFTGRWPHELSVGWNTPLDGEAPTLAEALATRGYATAGFVANLAYGARLWGLSRGFAHYEDFPVTPGQVVLATSLGRQIATWDAVRDLIGNHELLNRRTAADIRSAIVAWLDRRPERPFFVFANFFDAHEPYEPPAGLRREFAGDYRRSGIEHRHNLWRGVNARRLQKWSISPSDAASELALYEAAISSLDRELGHLFAQLDRRGLLDNTLIVLTADHGEQFGEKGLWGHMQSLYRPAVHVPLIIRPPAGTNPTHVRHPVSLRDLPSTVLDLVSDEPGMFPGFSLAPLWETPDRDSILISPAISELRRGLVERQWYPIASGFEMHAWLNGPLFYICNPDATEELYDLASDPGESVNLAGTLDGNRAILALRRGIAPYGPPPPGCPPPEDVAPRPPVRLRDLVSTASNDWSHEIH